MSEIHRKNIPPITVARFEDAAGGYKILPSWRRPIKIRDIKKIDLWFPEIAPSPSLSRNYRRGKITWNILAETYQNELRSATMIEFLKPLALLSQRKQLVLLCDCKPGKKCPNQILASSLEACRKSKNFVMKSPCA